MPISQPTNQTAHIETSIPGPRSEELRQREARLVAPGIQALCLRAGIAVDFAEGSAITDLDGNRFLDAIGGIGVNGLGHSHPVFVKAVQEQVARFSVSSFCSSSRVELLERLAEHAPAPGVNRLQLYSSGAEAVESALRLAKAFTGKNEFVSFWGGFHGKTQGVLGLMGSDFKKGMGPMVPGQYVIPFPDPYRPPFETQGSLTDACLDFAAKHLKYNSTGNIAAFIVEPIQGTAGNIVPPPDFLPKLKELAHSMGALLIVDEMITGFGRTGTYWGSEHSGVSPDIVTLGKQFGGGYPISGVLSREDIVQSAPWSNPSGSSSSYGGNALASAAAATALKIIDDEELVKNSKEVGQHLLERLRPLEDKYPFIGQVRGKGMLIGIDLVEDKKTKVPLSREVCGRLYDEHLKRGLLTMAYAPNFRLQPAMSLDRETADNICAILEETFDTMNAEGWWKP